MFTSSSHERGAGGERKERREMQTCSGGGGQRGGVCLFSPDTWYDAVEKISETINTNVF